MWSLFDHQATFGKQCPRAGEETARVIHVGEHVVAEDGLDRAVGLSQAFTPMTQGSC